MAGAPQGTPDEFKRPQGNPVRTETAAAWRRWAVWAGRMQSPDHQDERLRRRRRGMIER